MRRFRFLFSPRFVSIAVLLVIFSFSFYFTGSLSARNEEKQRSYLADVIRQAAVQCYALEGAYPPNVQYLSDRYGVSFDTNKYYVYYKLEGANLPPDIDVFEKGGHS